MGRSGHQAAKLRLLFFQIAIIITASAAFGADSGQLAPEIAFANFYRGAWEFDRGCLGSFENNPAYTRDCLHRQGYSLDVMVAPCAFQAVETIPIPKTAARTWDGKIIGPYVVRRKIAFSLKGLDQSLIKRNASNVFQLYFAVQPGANHVREIALSDSPGTWISIPTPPIYPVPADLLQALTFEPTDTKKYSEDKLKYILDGYDQSDDLPYFSAGDYVMLSTYSFSDDDSAQWFVNLIKSLINKCT